MIRGTTAEDKTQIEDGEQDLWGLHCLSTKESKFIRSPFLRLVWLGLAACFELIEESRVLPQHIYDPICEVFILKVEFFANDTCLNVFVLSGGITTVNDILNSKTEAESDTCIIHQEGDMHEMSNIQQVVVYQWELVDFTGREASVTLLENVLTVDCRGGHRLIIKIITIWLI